MYVYICLVSIPIRHSSTCACMYVCMHCMYVCIYVCLYKQMYMLKNVLQSNAHIPIIGAVFNLVGGGRAEISIFFSRILPTVFAFCS